MKNGMRSTINFETHISNDKVSFLDVEVHLMNGQLSTNLYTKLTDAHLYLNAKSSHPAYVTRNISKGQFIRIRRICSNIEDYSKNGQKPISFLVKRGYKQSNLEKCFKEIMRIDRETLFEDQGKQSSGAYLMGS